MDVKEIITDDERKSLLKDMEHLLDEYDYDYTEEALDRIINTWAENKADLITAFKKHPNYLKGKFMIVFSHNFARETSTNALRDFAKWLLDLDNALAVREFMPDDMKDYCTSYGKKLPGAIFNFVINLYQFSDQYIDEATAGKFNEMLPDIHAHNGQKMSRVMNKLLTYIGYNKLPDYNREFAKYADAINPLQIVRHTVLSVNPLDYLTMSFGNSWASCHTIDKENRRHMESSYHGMYCAGTVSYMLDATSIITFVHDHADVDFANEGKIFRNMFHYGKDILVQARVYPRGNDGNIDLYSMFRNYVQNELTPLLGLTDTTWRKKENGNVSNNVRSCGAHYRDYTSFSSCNVSYPRERSESRDNVIEIGHRSICPFCGREINEGNGVISHSNCLI